MSFQFYLHNLKHLNADIPLYHRDTLDPSEVRHQRAIKHAHRPLFPQTFTFTDTVAIAKCLLTPLSNKLEFMQQGELALARI